MSSADRRRQRQTIRYQGLVPTPPPPPGGWCVSRGYPVDTGGAQELRPCGSCGSLCLSLRCRAGPRPGRPHPPVPMSRGVHVLRRRSNRRGFGTGLGTWGVGGRGKRGHGIAPCGSGRRLMSTRVPVGKGGRCSALWGPGSFPRRRGDAHQVRPPPRVTRPLSFPGGWGWGGGAVCEATESPHPPAHTPLPLPLPHSLALLPLPQAPPPPPTPPPMAGRYAEPLGTPSCPPLSLKIGPQTQTQTPATTPPQSGGGGTPRDLGRRLFRAPPPPPPPPGQKPLPQPQPPLPCPPPP